MINSLINWVASMPLSTSLVISAILYVLILFAVAICNELYERGVARKSFAIDEISNFDLSSGPFHIVAAFASILWFITLPIGLFAILSFLLVKLVRFLARKIVGIMIVDFDDLCNKKRNIER